MERVLVTGGAGYIGSVLVHKLLNKGYWVRVLDNLRFGGESLLAVMNHENFEFMKGDIRDKKCLNKAIKNVNHVVHLAAIVGDPACAKEPKLAGKTNYEASVNLFEMAKKSRVKRFVFASTCSNYGKMANPNSYIDESGELMPVSLYAELKVAFERYILNSEKVNGFIPTCLRIATVYGLSPRIRFDLTVNEFTKELTLGRELLVYGEQFWRPYCHVTDVANAIIQVFQATERLVEHEVFNVGNTQENYTKKMIVEIVKKHLPDSKIKHVRKDEDPRDYKVSFQKIYDKLGFTTSKTIEDGIKEIISLIKSGILTNPDDPKYRNTDG